MALGSRYTVLTQVIDDGRLVRSTDADPTVVLLPDQVAPLVAIGAISPTPLLAARNEADGTPSAATMPAARALAGKTPAGVYTLAASANQTTGVIGTMLSAPTSSDNLAKQLRVALPAGTRAITVDLSLFTGLAVGAVWLAIESLNDGVAAAKFASRTIEVFRLQPGARQSYGVVSADLDLTNVYIVGEYAPGAGYGGASVWVQCWDAPMADQINLRWAGQVRNTLISQHMHIPFSQLGSAANKVPRYSNVAALNGELTLTGTDDYTLPPYLQLNGTSYVSDKSQACADFFTLVPGQQLLMVPVFAFTTDPSGAYVFSASVATTTGEGYGGFGLQFPGAGSAKMKWQPNNDANADLGDLLSQTTGQLYCGLIFIDTLRDQVLTFKNGTPKAAFSIPTPSNPALSKYPIIKAATGVSWGARVTAGSYGNPMQAASLLGQFFAIKLTNKDIATDVPAMAIAATRYHPDLADIFRGL